MRAFLGDVDNNVVICMNEEHIDQIDEAVLPDIMVHYEAWLKELFPLTVWTIDFDYEDEPNTFSLVPLTKGIDTIDEDNLRITASQYNEVHFEYNGYTVLHSGRANTIRGDVIITPPRPDTIEWQLAESWKALNEVRQERKVQYDIAMAITDERNKAMTDFMDRLAVLEHDLRDFFWKKPAFPIQLDLIYSIDQKKDGSGSYHLHVIINSDYSTWMEVQATKEEWNHIEQLLIAAGNSIESRAVDACIEQANKQIQKTKKEIDRINQNSKPH
jgi:hypothetical protein